MPRTTPAIKVDAVRRLGASVELAGDTYAEAETRCEELRDQRELTLVHPFDDPLVIAGQGTIGDEILRHAKGELDVVFVPIGGGGLIAGIGTILKTLKPRSGSLASSRSRRMRCINHCRDRKKCDSTTSAFSWMALPFGRYLSSRLR